MTDDERTALEHGDVAELIGLSDYDLLEGLRKALEGEHDKCNGTRLPVLDGGGRGITLDVLPALLEPARPHQKR